MSIDWGVVMGDRLFKRLSYCYRIAGVRSVCVERAIDMRILVLQYQVQNYSGVRRTAFQ